MLSRDQVAWLYRCLLGREPESEEAISANQMAYNTFAEARAGFMSSLEFRTILASTSLSYVADLSPEPVRKDLTIKKLALAAILKNEALNVEVMLRSCLPIVDFVAVVDTGSLDATLSIAENLLISAGVPYRLQSSKFNSFAESRNMALDLVPPEVADWVLMLDGDEHLVPEDYNKVLTLLNEDVDGWRLPRLNFLDAAKTITPAPYPDYQGRLIRNRVDRPIRFSGRVHEQALNVGHWADAPRMMPGDTGGPHIHHMGQVDLTLDRWREKHAFYQRLQAASNAV